VDAKISTLLTPPVKVNMEFGVDVGFDPFAHYLTCSIGGKRHYCGTGATVAAQAPLLRHRKLMPGPMGGFSSLTLSSSSSHRLQN
jgi:hypothetical protein